MTRDAVAGWLPVTSAPGPDWATFRIPGSDRPVRMQRLHVDPATKASVSVVSFPPGWRREERGHYTCAEEFLVMEGDLSVSGGSFGAGDYVFLPPGNVRESSFTADGCLAVAYFSGRPEWVVGDPADPVDQAAVHLTAPAPGLLRKPGGETPGACEMVDGLDGERYDVDVDLLCPEERTWTHLPAGQGAPRSHGRVLLRRWG